MHVRTPADHSTTLNVDPISKKGIGLLCVHLSEASGRESEADPAARAYKNTHFIPRSKARREIEKQI